MARYPLSAQALLALTTALSVGCGVDAFEGDDPLDQQVATAHGLYLSAAGDDVDTLFQETYYVWLFNEIGITPSQPLVYHKYQSLRHIEGLTGRFTDGFTETGTLRFHSIWAADNHQSVHAVVTSLVGHAPAIINEGFATAHQVDPLTGDFVPRWENEPLDNLARIALQGGDLPTLDEMLESESFFAFDRNLVFPVAGSFVHFLIQDYGYQPVLDLIGQTGFNDTGVQLRTNYEGLFGEAFDATWQRWEKFLIP